MRNDVERLLDHHRLWGSTGDGEADALAYVLNLASAALHLANTADRLEGVPGAAAPPGTAEWLRWHASALTDRLDPARLPQ
jgi:hypothetical protein